MPFELSKVAGAAILAACLAGCTGDGDVFSANDKSWGEANRQTMAAQIIDPTPHYDTAVPETSGEHAAQAVGRYRKGQVIQPDRISTSSVNTGGSSGSSSGGGGKSALGN